MDRDREREGADGRGQPRASRPAALAEAAQRVRLGARAARRARGARRRAAPAARRDAVAAVPRRDREASAAARRRARAAPLSARPHEGGDRRRRAALPRQRELDRRRARREGQRPPQLRARHRHRRRPAARSGAGAVRADLERRRVRELQAARGVPGAAGCARTVFQASGIKGLAKTCNRSRSSCTIRSGDRGRVRRRCPARRPVFDRRAGGDARAVSAPPRPRARVPVPRARHESRHGRSAPGRVPPGVPVAARLARRGEPRDVDRSRARCASRIATCRSAAGACRPIR